MSPTFHQIAQAAQADRRAAQEQAVSKGARGLGQASEDFDVQGTISNVQGAQQVATNLQSSIQQYGNTDPNALQQNAWQGIVTGFNAILPGAGTALDQIYDLLPHAAAGPGDCVTDPPADPTHLSAWPHYTSWASRYGNYADPPAGSFEAFAYPLIVQNAELQNNCFTSLMVPWNVLLAGLVASWNATHDGPAQTVTRTGLTSYGGDSDPLAIAMTYATMPAPAPGQFAANGPNTVSVSVNRGAQHPKNLPGLVNIVRASGTTAPTPPSAAASASASPAATTGLVIAGVGVAGFLTAAIVSYATGKSLDAVLGGVWRTLTGKR